MQVKRWETVIMRNTTPYLIDKNLANFVRTIISTMYKDIFMYNMIPATSFKRKKNLFTAKALIAFACGVIPHTKYKKVGKSNQPERSNYDKL